MEKNRRIYDYMIFLEKIKIVQPKVSNLYSKRSVRFHAVQGGTPIGKRRGFLRLSRLEVQITEFSHGVQDETPIIYTVEVSLGLHGKKSNRCHQKPAVISFRGLRPYLYGLVYPRQPWPSSRDNFIVYRAFIGENFVPVGLVKVNPA